MPKVFIHVPVDRFQKFSQFWSIKNKAPMNIFVQVSDIYMYISQICTHIWFCFCCCCCINTRSRIVDWLNQEVSIYLVSWENFRILLFMWGHQLLLLPSLHGVTVILHAHQHLGCQSFNFSYFVVKLWAHIISVKDSVRETYYLQVILINLC